jgi:hypothetical protein
MWLVTRLGKTKRLVTRLVERLVERLANRLANRLENRLEKWQNGGSWCRDWS